MLLLSSADNNFRNTIRELNGLDPDHGRCYIGPHLGTKCLQRILADDKITQYAKSSILGSIMYELHR